MTTHDQDDALGGLGGGVRDPGRFGSILPPGPDVRFVAISVGNTRTQLAGVRGVEPGERRVVPTADIESAVLAASELARAVGAETGAAAVLASVREPAARELAERLGRETDLRVRRLGSDLPIPIAHRLSPGAQTGQDRLLNALAAYRVMGQACAVVDAGTAVTVDFVDGEGVFHGGAIAPGVQMQLDALHAGTDALPKLLWAEQHDSQEPFGPDTAAAMTLGVRGGVVGLVRYLVERYAEAYGAFPSVVATGGDAQRLFSGDEVVERIVPDLTLRGIGIAVRLAIADDTSDDAIEGEGGIGIEP